MQKTAENLYPTLQLSRRAPANLKEEDRHLFAKALHTTLDEAKLFTYKSHNVTPEGIVFKGLALDKDLLIYPKHAKTYNLLYLLSSLVKRKKTRLPGNETYLLVFDYWSNSIFHWMCDALPRLQAVKEQAKDCILLLPENYEYQYIHDSLKAFELKGIYTMPLKAYANCARLLAPQQLTTSGEINPQNFKGLRQTILDHYRPLFKGRYTRPNIYISRSKAKYRRVLNEEEILPILKKYDFEIVHFEDMDFAQQVECCYHAVNAVSIHGANLTNTMYMQPGGNVLEFRKTNDPDNNYFYAIADSVDCSYYYQQCKTIDPRPGYNFFDLEVDKDLFEKNLRLMLKL